MVGVAVNVTLVPLQIVEPGLVAMLTAGAALGFTVKVIERTVLVPHALCAATVIAPPVEPEPFLYKSQQVFSSQTQRKLGSALQQIFALVLLHLQ